MPNRAEPYLATPSLPGLTIPTLTATHLGRPASRNRTYTVYALDVVPLPNWAMTSC